MMEIYEIFKQQLITNNVFTGLAGGALFATIIASIFFYAKSFPSKILRFLKYQLTVSIYISNDDEVFNVINEWLARHIYSKRSRRLKVSAWNGFDNTSWSIAPGDGWHFIFFNKKPIFIQRLIDKDGGIGLKPRESYTVLTFGRRQNIIRDLLSDAEDIINDESKIKIYTWSDYWALSCSKTKRDSSTIILKDKQFENILNDIELFKSSKEWYLSKGIPYRRGYLMHGPPGTGKSSIASILAGIYNIPIYILSISGVKDDNELSRAMLNVPEKALLLIEDIDATNNFGQREEKKKKSEDSITLSGLLNSIDGVGAKEGRILIMTTNHPDKLDDALIRPGRVDVKEEIGLFGQEEAKKMMRMFYKNAVQEDIDRISSLIKTPISPAVLQNIFMKNRHDLNEVTGDMIKVCRKAS